MRQYRGRRKDTGEWVYGWLVVTDKAHYIIPNGVKEITTVGGGRIIKRNDMIEVIPETVGQSSGLKDCNEAEVFEGDIIKPFRNYRVFYVVERFRCGLICKRVDDPFVTLDPYNVRDNCIVIGNIHDHPHLLKGEGQ